MFDDLERQLEAFGRTLSEVTGEPIRSDDAGRPATSVRPVTRRWARLGAAACLVAAVVGIGLAIGNRASAPSAPADGSTPTGDTVGAVLPAPDVPIDALHLDDSGWTLTRHSRSAFTVIDMIACGELRDLEVAALPGHQVVVEEYRGPTEASWMTITHVRYPDRATALARLTPFTDLRECPDGNLDDYEQLELDIGAGIDGSGHRWQGSVEVAFVDADGVAVLARVVDDGSDATLQLVAERSVALLRGGLRPVSPGTTATDLDDLAAAIGADPVGLLADGWTEVSYGLTLFEPQTWPVCDTSELLATVAGAPSLDVAYVAPSDDGVLVRFIGVDDAALRLGLDESFVAQSSCPASQPDLGADGAADPGRGRWSRSEGELTSVLVAPPDAGALPLVAIITGDPDHVDELADRVADFLAGPARKSAPEPVPDDPLGLERDGWILVQRSTERFSMTAEGPPCGEVDGLAAIDGVEQVHDILTPPDGNGLDLDVQILDIGSVERGNALADAIMVIGRCLGEAEGIEIDTGALSSVRATWFRAGPEFALVTIVGDGPRSIVLEIEGAPFDDDLIGELAHRADDYLGGRPVEVALAPTGAVAPAGSITVTDGPTVTEQQVEPDPGQVKLWVSNQSFEDDPVAITVAIDGVTVVDDSFAVGSQHNWFSFMVSGLQPGEHTITASSDTGATFEGTFRMPADQAHWMVIDHWFAVDDDESRFFMFRESNEPIYFA